MADEPLKQVGPYKIQKLLFSGGIGKIYQAVHAETNQQVFLKTISPEQKSSATILHKEILALSSMAHPYIANFLSHGLDEELPWYAVESAGDLNLRDQINAIDKPSSSDAKKKSDTKKTDWKATEAPWLVGTKTSTWKLTPDLEPVELEDAKEEDNWEAISAPWELDAPKEEQKEPTAANSEFLACADSIYKAQKHLSVTKRQQICTQIWQLCQALAFLHGQGFVHCNLTPDNVVVGSNGQLSLIDLGSMIRFPSAEHQALEDIVPKGYGSVGYMSPEQIQGEVLDPRADIYSLGCLFYELLTGSPPFVGKDEEVVQQHLYVTPVKPSQVLQGVSPVLDQLVMQMLAKKREDRVGHALVVAAVVKTLGAQVQQFSAPPKAEEYLYQVPTVGVDWLMRCLLDRIRVFQDGDGQLILLDGSTGSGKTRVLWELQRFVPKHTSKIILSHPSKALDEPLGLFKPFLKAVAAVLANTNKNGVKAFFPDIFDAVTLSQYEESLKEIPGITPTLLFQLSNSRPNHQETIRILERLIHNWSKVAPLLFLFDNLDKADPLSLSMLRILARKKQFEKIMIIATLSSEKASPPLHALLEEQKQDQNSSLLHMIPLEEHHINLLLQKMLALPRPPKLFGRYLTLQSKGNPGFIVRYLKAAAREGLLWRDELGRWQIGKSKSSPNVFRDYQQLALPKTM